MCLEDVKIARLKKSRVWRTGGSIIIPANPNRLGFWLSAESGDRSYLVYLPPYPDATGAVAQTVIAYCANQVQGNIEVAYSPPIWVGLDQVGPIVKDQLQLYSSSSDGAVAIEVYLDIETPTSLDPTILPKGP